MSSSSGTITVSGHGEIAVTPDGLRIELSVESGASGVADALGATRSTMADLRAAIKNVGVSAEDLQTSGLNLWSRQDREGRADGFTASESLGVLLRDPAQVDVVLQIASETAGDRLRVGGVSFTVLDPGAARDEARRLALAEAERVANVYAEAAGRTLGALVSIAEGSVRVVAPRMARAAVMAADAGMEPGRQNVGIDVTAEWELV